MLLKGIPSKSPAVIDINKKASNGLRLAHEIKSTREAMQKKIIKKVINSYV